MRPFRKTVNHSDGAKGKPTETDIRPLMEERMVSREAVMEYLALAAMSS